MGGPTPESGSVPSRASGDVDEDIGRVLGIAASREKRALRVCCPIRRPGASLLGEECALRGLREGFVIVCRPRSGAGWDGRGWGGVYLTLTWGWVEEGARAAAEDTRPSGRASAEGHKAAGEFRGPTDVKHVAAKQQQRKGKTEGAVKLGCAGFPRAGTKRPGWGSTEKMITLIIPYYNMVWGDYAGAGKSYACQLNSKKHYL